MQYDKDIVNAVLKPTCVISAAAANYISRTFVINRDNRFESEQLSATAIAIQRDLTKSGLSTYFNDIECAKMLVKWVEFRLQEMEFEDAVDWRLKYTAQQPTQRARTPVVRFNPNPKVRKLMAMVHDRTDVAAIERFFSTIGAELALIICQSLRGFFTIRPIGGSKHVKNIRWRPEILFWLMACYNNPMFAKTYHIGWKYGGYEEDSLAIRSQRGSRNRAEMIRFLDYYTLKKFDGGWHRTLPGGVFTFSFMDIEPSYYWVCADDSCVFNVNWHGIKKAICRYPYPTSISTASSQWAYIQSYDLSNSGSSETHI